ncbi:glycosyltransferase family 2 protein [Xylanibacter ruminicola]|nr:glycosyltransferase family 2 protein [Xylanibacter ruminicola]
MNKMMNFTVIIPHRNIPMLLGRLIKSIPMRDDLEIIVVDDHSDACVVEQLRSLERENLDLMLNQECHGAGYARNCALPVAKGKWVLFADADDFFNTEFNDFLNEYINSDADIVYFNANSLDSETFEPSHRVDHLHEFIDEYHRDKERGALIMRYLFTEPWCKMVKLDLIKNNDIRFEETSIRNDVRYSYLVGHYAEKIVVDERQLYCVTTRQNSVSRGIGYQASMDELKVFAGWKNFLMDHHIPLELPKFDLCLYNFTRHLWKDNKRFWTEYKILINAGLSHVYIINKVLFYIWKSIGYKL